MITPYYSLLYIALCLVCFRIYLAVSKWEQMQVTVKIFLGYVLMAVVPVVNLVMGIMAIWCMYEHVFTLEFLDKVVIDYSKDKYDRHY